MTIALSVYYCRVCAIPPEFCAFTPSAERCKKALAHDNPELYAKIYGSSTESASRDQNPPASISTSEAVGEALASEVDEKLHIAGDSAPPPVVAEATEDTDKKHQSRGGRGLQRDESAKLDKEAQKRAKARLQIKRTDRNRRKAVTHIYGLELFGLDLKKVAKTLAGKYACGCSVVKDNNGREEVDVQGDFVDDLLSFLPREFPEIKANQIDVLEK